METAVNEVNEQEICFVDCEVLPAGTCSIYPLPGGGWVHVCPKHDIDFD
jgi:hypothetical protein